MGALAECLHSDSVRSAEKNREGIFFGGRNRKNTRWFMLVVDSIPIETAFKMIDFLETCFGFSVILGHFEACFF